MATPRNWSHRRGGYHGDVLATRRIMVAAFGSELPRNARTIISSYLAAWNVLRVARSLTLAS